MIQEHNPMQDASETEAQAGTSGRNLLMPLTLGMRAVYFRVRGRVSTADWDYYFI